MQLERIGLAFRGIYNGSMKITNIITEILIMSAFLQGEISQAKPLGAPGNDTIKTTGSFLTIRGIRSVSTSKNYDVEFTIRPASKRLSAAVC